jgi:hypothetical protein
MLSALVVGLVFGQSVSKFDLAKLPFYDGRGMDGVVFGQSSDKEMKKAFKTDKGAIRPEGLVIQNDGTRRVDALLDGRGGDAKAIGLWIEPKVATEVGDVIKELGDGERGYMTDRSSNWSIAAFPDRGIAVFGVREGNREYVDGVLLSDPARIKQLSRSFDTGETKIIDLREIFERKDPRVFIRAFDLSMTAKNIDVGDRNREEGLLESFASRRADTRNIVSGRGGDGTINVTVAIDFEKVNVNVSLSGSNEIGKISASGSSSYKFRVERDVAYYRRDKVEDTVLDALNQALDSAENAIRNQKPPTPAEDRRRMEVIAINGAIR